MIILSTSKGVSLNLCPTVNNDNDERHTQNSQSSIHTWNVNSSLELPNKYLCICHYNICSLTNNLDEIKLLLSSFNNQRKDRPNLILGIAETFLNESWSDASLAVESYFLFRGYRSANEVGGPLMWVPAHLPISRRSDPEMHGIESIWVELLHPRSTLFIFVFLPTSLCRYFVLWANGLDADECRL